MFRRQSWASRAGAALMLVATMSAGSVALPHADERDADCSPILVAHDESAHHIDQVPNHLRPRPNTASSAIRFVRFIRRSIPSSNLTTRPALNSCTLRGIDRARLLAWTLVPGRAPPV